MECFSQHSVNNLWAEHKLLSFPRFKTARVSINDDDRTGRHSTDTTRENVATVQRFFHEDRSRTFAIWYMSTNYDWWIKQIETSDLLQTMKTFCQEWLLVTRAGFMVMIQWKSPSLLKPNKCRQVTSNVKSMLIVFFDMEGIVHREFLPTDQTVNSKSYCNVLKQLLGDIRRKRPELWQHEIGHCITTMRHLTVFHTNIFDEKINESIEEIQGDSQAVLNSFTENDFLHIFQNWRIPWNLVDICAKRLLGISVRFRIFIAPVREYLDRTSYI